MAGTTRNKTSSIVFVILGFSHHPEMKVIFFILFLCIYIFTVLGNLMILVIINMDPVLHTPMYFFLRNLSFLEICISVTLPRVLVSLLSTDTSITFAGCAAQMYFFLLFGATECCLLRKIISFTACALQLNCVILFVTCECFLLGAMAYDRQVAICHPLHYATMMNRDRCFKMAVGSWLSGVPVALGFTTWLFTLPFCGRNTVDHFFCDVSPVLKLVCADTALFELLIFIAIIIIVMIPFSLIATSYLCIIHAVLQIPSAVGQRRAFSTCAAHLVVVTLFYSTTGIIHLRPKSGLSSNMKKMVSLSYTVVTPMLNPIIYSLRNQEVKQSLKRCVVKCLFPSPSKQKW
uniref:G-protein coupled receptors family 1 profile domain-containing protein n=2 Tax=Strigops habroptila TaxID=2489341 RepID=A0A672URG4_STRHB